MNIFLILKLLLVIFISVLGTKLATYWLNFLYLKHSNILSYKETIAARSRYRQLLLPFLLGTIFGWQIIALSDNAATIILKMICCYFLLLFTFSDFEQEVIFDHMLLPFAIFGIIFTLTAGLPFFNHLTAAAGGGISFLLLAILTRGGIGGGDIKLIAALGIWLGTDNLLTVTCIGLLTGGVFAFLLLISKRKKRTDYFAYGPFFTLTALFYLLF